VLKLPLAALGLALVLVLVVVIALVGVGGGAQQDGPGATAFLRRGSGIDVRLLVADTPAPFLVDVDRTTVQPVSGLPSDGERGVVVTPVGEDALVLSFRLCGRCRRVSAYLVRHGSTDAFPLRKALQFVPARDGQGVWMLDRRGAGRCTVRELSLDRRPRRPARTVGCSTVLVTELPAGLLVTSGGLRSTHGALLESDGDVVRLGDSGAQPVVGNLLLSGSDRRTPLIVRDARTGASRRLTWPGRPGYALSQVTGEPNGHLAIVEFARYSPVHKIDMWLLDTLAWSWHHLPGMPIRLIPKITDVEWAADGRVVILSDKVLGVWQPGDGRITFRDVTAPDQPGSEFVPW
jgi:hypothetical protein